MELNREYMLIKNKFQRDRHDEKRSIISFMVNLFRFSKLSPLMEKAESVNSRSDRRNVQKEHGG